MISCHTHRYNDCLNIITAIKVELIPTTLKLPWLLQHYIALTKTCSGDKLQINFSIFNLGNVFRHKNVMTNDSIYHTV